MLMLKQIRRLNRKNYFKLDKQTIQYEQNVLVCDKIDFLYFRDTRKLYNSKALSCTTFCSLTKPHFLHSLG